MINGKPTRRIIIRAIIAWHQEIAQGDEVRDPFYWGLYPVPLLAAVGGMRR